MLGTGMKIAAGIVAGALSTGGLALATIPAADGTITACYSRGGDGNHVALVQEDHVSGYGEAGQPLPDQGAYAVGVQGGPGR